MDWQQERDAKRLADIQAEAFFKKQRESQERPGRSKGGCGTVVLVILGVVIYGAVKDHGNSNKTTPNAPSAAVSIAQPATPAFPYQGADALSPDRLPQPARGSSVREYGTLPAPPSAPSKQDMQSALVGQTPRSTMPIGEPGAQLPVATDTAAEPVATTDPRYPPQAMRERHAGTVQVLIFVGSDGSVTNAVVQSSSGYPELDRSAIEAVHRWRFRPAYSQGRTVASEVMLPIHFSLN